MTGAKGGREHWDKAYAAKGEAQVSWFQEVPLQSLDLLRGLGLSSETSVIDIGGGASRLVDALLAEGVRDIAVLDLSQAALDLAQERLGAAAAQVEWIPADVTTWRPARTYDFWHDRAAFHFLTHPDDRRAYVDRLCAALAPGGHAVIATFAPDGPERCSGLPVMRYDAQALTGVLGPSFAFLEERRETHTTPWGSSQAFQFSAFLRSA